MAVTPVTPVKDVVIDATIDSVGGSPGVPTSRVINATSPIRINGGNSADLSADVTISGTVTGGGTSLVGSGRLVSGTAPVKISGGASHDLTTDIVISVDTFAGSAAGLVPGTSGGDVNKTFRGDGTWVTGTTAGVSSVIAGSAISLSPVSGLGDVTLSVRAAGLANPGYVPAIGSADPTMALVKTNPPSWAVMPGAGAAVTLQGSTPGTADVGHAHISGSFIAEGRSKFGGDAEIFTPGGSGWTLCLVDAANGAQLIERFINPQVGGIVMQASRGTLAAPAANVADDTIGFISWQGHGSSAGGGGLIQVRCDGTPGNYAPGKIEYIVYGNAGTPVHRMAQSGLGLYIGPGNTYDNTKTARNSLQIDGSLGLTHTLTTVTGPADVDDDIIVTVDCTTGTQDLLLPLASFAVGTVYIFRKIDTTNNIATIKAHNGSATIETKTGYQLSAYLETVAFYSDGTNWRILWHTRPRNLFTQIANSTAYANSNTRAAVSATANLPSSIRFPYTAGMVVRFRAGGVYGTTGTPTLKIEVCSGTGGNVHADSTALTIGSAVTGVPWEIEGRMSLDSSTAGRFAGGVLRLTNNTGKIDSYPVKPAAYPAGFAADWQVWATWGTANTSNTLTTQFFTLEMLDPSQTG